MSDNGHKNFLLPFQKDIIENAIDNKNGLFVLAPGLGVCQLVAVLLKLQDEKRKYNSDEGGVTIVVGADQVLREALQSELARIHPRKDWFESDDEGPFPKHVTADVATSERIRLYGSSSCVFVTTRILVVDLLSGRLNTEDVSGLIVLNGHHVTESSGEGFVIKLYRTKGGKGFVRAFSEHPVAFTSEFSKIEKTMRVLYSSNLQIWPRFRTAVQDDLEGKAPELVEISVLTDPGAGIIYEAIAELLDISVKELRKHEKLDTTDLSPTEGLMRAFDEIIRRQLSPVWHTVSPKIRQLVDDMKTLRNLANYLLKFDAVTYLKYLENLRVTDGSKSAWMFHSAAHVIFEAAKNRVYKIEGLEEKPELGSKHRTTEIKPVLEELPKWKALLEIAYEIMDEPQAHLPVLVFCEDEYTVDQLRKVIKPDGAKEYMESMYLSYLGSKVGPQKSGSKRNAAGKPVQLLPHSQVEEVALYKEAKEIQRLRKVAQNNGRADLKGAVSQPSFVEWFEKNLVFIPSDAAGHASLWKYHPSRIVVYDPDVALVRQIELYCAQRESEKARVYLLRYEPSPELDKYHARLARERQAFEDLIRTKGSMALNISDSEIKFTPVDRADNSISANSLSRKGGGRQSSNFMERIRLIVDVREFMSNLPAVLYSQGYSLVPVTLEVGDYVLSPEICVERKTIPDLRGSLQSGRLYQQAESMCKYYPISILLIEFDGEKAFALQSAAELGEDIQPGHIMSRLVLLCLHHPRLRLVWSRSLHATTDLFRQLKANYDEPDPVAAGNVGIQGNQPAINTTALDMLRRLPGVNDSNFRGLCKEAGSLAGLADLSLDRISVIMGSEVSGKRLYDFLHQKSTL